MSDTQIHSVGFKGSEVSESRSIVQKNRAQCDKTTPTVDDVNPAWPSIYYATIIPKRF